LNNVACKRRLAILEPNTGEYRGEYLPGLSKRTPGIREDIFWTNFKVLDIFCRMSFWGVNTKLRLNFVPDPITNERDSVVD
jgi:hypothetical protein